MLFLCLADKRGVFYANGPSEKQCLKIYVNLDRLAAIDVACNCIAMPIVYQSCLFLYSYLLKSYFYDTWTRSTDGR